MTRRLTVAAGIVPLLLSGAGSAQTGSTPDTRNPQPLYRLTIVSRDVKAINYGHRSTPTDINFKGTPLLPGAKGRATIESKRGATLITARFSDVPPPTRFGPQYLTYVVWAISTEGRPENLGELLLDGSNKAKLSTSTNLQTFAMIVTAEPHFSVSQPSDAVVMGNVLAPGTVGKVEELTATYELLPRNEFTYSPGSQTPHETRMVSRNEYDAILALYQAQNALQIAEAQHAQRYAPERMARARQMFERAQGYPKSLHKEIVALAREATQLAEDARMIAAKRSAAERTAQEQQQALEAQSQAEAARQAAQAESERTRQEAARAIDAAERAVQAASQAEAALQTQTEVPESPAAEADSSQEAITVDPNQFSRQDPHATTNRTHILATLKPVFETRDTARGIVVTIPESIIESGSVRASLSQLASTVQPYRDLHIRVEAHTDQGGYGSLQSTRRQAELVRQALIDAGVSPNLILVRGWGNSRPRVSNATASGRAQNRRVEIIIAGDAIGPIATWDSTYEL